MRILTSCTACGSAMSAGVGGMRADAAVNGIELMGGGDGDGIG
jgi:hypothetical protein